MGQATASRVIVAAREVLIEHGCTNFSMRTVAAHAGLHLANVQYYFPTRYDLARALMIDTGERYRAQYAKVLAEAPADRTARFEAFVEFNIQDIQRTETKRYFIQLWAMLMSLDEGKGAFLNELYHIYIEQLSERIAELDANTTQIERRRRATILAAMIEGLTVVSGAHGGKREEREALMRLAKRVGLQIATGTIAS